MSNGREVLVRARVSLYEGRSEFQRIVEHMEEAGIGTLMRQLEQLKARLQEEGLFDPARKKPLPFLPRPAIMGPVVSLVYRCIATHLIKQAGFSHKNARTGAVTLIDRVRPCARPFGRPTVVQIGSPADLSALWVCAQSECALS